MRDKTLYIIIFIFFLLVSCNVKKKLFRNFNKQEGICIKLGENYIFYPKKNTYNSPTEFFNSIDSNDVGVNIKLGIGDIEDSVMMTCAEKIAINWAGNHVAEKYRHLYVSSIILSTEFIEKTNPKLDKGRSQKLRSISFFIENDYRKFYFYSPHHFINFISCKG